MHFLGSVLLAKRDDLPLRFQVIRASRCLLFCFLFFSEKKKNTIQKERGEVKVRGKNTQKKSKGELRKREEKKKCVK